MMQERDRSVTPTAARGFDTQPIAHQRPGIRAQMGPTAQNPDLFTYFSSIVCWERCRLGRRFGSYPMSRDTVALIVTGLLILLVAIAITLEFRL